MARLEVAIDPTGATRGARVIKRELDEITRKAREAEVAVSGIGGGRRPGGGPGGRPGPVPGGGVIPPLAIPGGLGGTTAGFVRLASTIGAATIAAGALSRAFGDIVRNGDRLRQIEGRFRALTGSATRAGDLIRDAFGIGAETGASFEAVTQALTRFRIAGDAINATDDEVAQLTENLLKLGQIGGSTTQEMTAGAIQLGQGLASGALRGEELRSVMENLPLVARQIAEGLGVSIGELREMGAEGELTAERVFGALLDGTDDLEKRFEELPVTVERAANSLATAWAQFTAELDRSTGTSQKLIGILEALKETLEGLSGVAAQTVVERTIENASLGQLRRQRQNLIGNQESAVGANRLSESIFEQTLAAYDKAINEILARQAQVQISPPTPLGDVGQFFPGRVQTSPEPPPAPPGNLSFPLLTDSKPTEDESAVRILESLRERAELLRHESRLIGRTEVAQARLNAGFEKGQALRDLMNAAARDHTTITPQQIEQAQTLAEQIERQAVANANAEEAVRRKAEADREAERAAERHAQAVQRIGDAITGAIQQAESFEEALKNVALQLANIALQGLSQPDGGILGAIIPGLSSLFSAGAGSIAPSGATFSTGTSAGVGRVPIGFAHGGSFEVGGAPGVDSNLVAFRATRGERVTIDPPGGMRERATTVYNIDARGADQAAIARLEGTIRELAGPGRVERRAVAAVSSAQHRGHRLGPR